MRLNPVNSGKRNYLYNNLIRTCKGSMLPLNEVIFVVDLVKKKLMEEKKLREGGGRGEEKRLSPMVWRDKK
ncbi:MAG TPA: hypothetical protein ENI51_09450 [Candidatus Atribacteria bacterium]|nr:hypothetical protein [Candidatus Atribacteria bacterium]